MSPRKRNAYMIVVGLGVAAVAVDRLFLLPPEEASGEPAPPPPVTSTPPPAAATATPVPAETTTAPSPVAARVAIADRLEAIALREKLDPARVEDAFEPPSAWLMADAGPANPVTSTAQRFRESHNLNAVMATGRDGYAIIDGRTLYIGQEMDGFTLVEVHKRTAVLVSGRERVELSLPGDP